ncbi:MAG: DUF3987 domain-containing protein [Gammaproteobacteria bacterium]|nr:DUF3987 domain-containing protein [Gammaproteobacteria bacterium]
MKKRTVYLALEANSKRELMQKMSDYVTEGWLPVFWPLHDKEVCTIEFGSVYIGVLGMTVAVTESTDIKQDKKRIIRCGDLNMQRKLDDWLNSYLLCTQNTEPRETYRLWSAISIIAGALQRKCRLDWGTLVFYPNMYIVLVGPPAARKGTAMNLARQFLEENQIKMAAEAITREALIRELKNSTDTVVTESGKMYFHSSLTIWSQELTVFLGYQNHQLMSDLTDWYDCRDQWTYRTKNMGTDEIIGVYVNIFGATTPDLIRSTMPLDAIGGGLTSRMVFIFEENKARPIAYPGLSVEEKALLEELKYDFARIHMLSGQFKTTNAFLEKWIRWYPAQEHNPPFVDSRFDGYMERRANHVMKLSMICNASRTGDMLVDVVDLERAIAILKQAEIKMPATFSGVGKLNNADTMTKIMADLGTAKTMLFSEILVRYKSDVDKWTLEKILESLEAMKFLRRIAMENDIKLEYTKRE